ncbi:D-alanyl-lipoteichoic acid acyltransferase DltB (MBOAT superfamily) [Chryseobacterium defluvii]|uniref:D-alanyl-lipoteichoic acid acyltransferase DltB (MBOAT superfamily) n=1 Tax=Chryseobacterium defluvii TaxID=160396 RepID=A0A840KGG4_9FLAO|nr:MBOAT family protein [Chryseobacterium defluvii]MBB4806623.1 D-alanyl-lipoteichoic acid acyltransferase DltB (MBOAT superfamily) [Chryseobacterium defluvii]
MLLNSYSFIAFFIILFLVYYLLGKNSKIQNVFLLIGSYVFYASWSWEFLSLLIISTGVTYFIGNKIKSAEGKSKVHWLRLGVFLILIQLLYFKYFNFFIENFNELLNLFGIRDRMKLLNILFPIGISFYSFRMMGYLLDIRNNKLKEIPSLLNYSVFIAFFPCIIAGPIDRATPFLNNIKDKRDFSSTQFTDGLKQILWGLFKKLVIADNIATITSPLFESYHTLNGSALFIGAMLYFIQLYSDFSGYTDMAMGIAKLLGIKIQQNFNYPLFAQNVADYWRRWHISLTSWLTEYVFTPLSITFRDYDKYGLIMAIMVNFLVVGFWHGAEWHYIFHGIVSGIMFIPLIWKGKMNKKVKSSNNIIPTKEELKNIPVTFVLFTLLMILFFVKDMEMAVNYYKGIFSLSFFQLPNYPVQKEIVLLIISMLIVEWIGRDKEYAIKEMLVKQNVALRWGFYYVLVFLVFLFYIAPKGFIYAQF